MDSLEEEEELLRPEFPASRYFKENKLTGKKKIRISKLEKYCRRVGANHQAHPTRI